jgi:predicted GNAT family acetyltransferase
VEIYSIPEITEQIRHRINNGTFFVWEDDIPVSQAENGRNTMNGAVVTHLYTPPHYRGSGYATACVATLSQQLLNRGHRFCILADDAKNAVADIMYRKIGYKSVSVVEEFRFD